MNKKLYVGYATVGGRGLIVIDSNGVSTTYKTTNSTIANNNVLDIKQLVNGSVAILTSSGLSIFNGTTFTNYTTPVMPSIAVKSITEDASGVLWIGVQGIGLVKFDGTSFTSVSSPSSSNVKKVQFGDGKVTLVDGNAVHSYSLTSSSWTTYGECTTWHINGCRCFMAKWVIMDCDQQRCTSWFGTKLTSYPRRSFGSI
jgi:ligand-binding sensor domain-containing protein